MCKFPGVQDEITTYEVHSTSNGVHITTNGVHSTTYRSHITTNGVYSTTLWSPYHHQRTLLVVVAMKNNMNFAG